MRLTPFVDLALIALSSVWLFDSEWNLLIEIVGLGGVVTFALVDHPLFELRQSLLHWFRRQIPSTGVRGDSSWVVAHNRLSFRSQVVAVGVAVVLGILLHVDWLLLVLNRGSLIVGIKVLLPGFKQSFFDRLRDSVANIAWSWFKPRLLSFGHAHTSVNGIELGRMDFLCVMVLKADTVMMINVHGIIKLQFSV